MNYIKKIKCLIEQVNNLITFKPKLEYNLTNNVLTSTYINGQQASAVIPLSEEDEHIPLLTGNTNDLDVSGGTAVAEFDARRLVAYTGHLQFEVHPNGGQPEPVSMLRLSDAFLSTINTTNYVEGTWAEFDALIQADELIPGQTYILTDYQTEYFIQGSNSSGVVKEKEITSAVSGYAVLDNNYEYNLNVGDSIEITELPVGYVGPVQVGDITTVTVVSSDYYFRFANGMQNTIGIKFKFFYDRYNTIPQNIIINDGSGKPIMKPQGVINTEVHDGTAYMDQTAVENLAVPTERLVLIAVDTNSFMKEGESDTFQGDYIEYDFYDTDIINDNNEVIGQRKGLITRRATFDIKIYAPIDRRVVRFRRWLLNLDSRTKFCNRDLDPTTTRVGSAGNFLFESNNRNPSQTAPFYIARLPEGEFQNINANAMRKTFQFAVEGNDRAKDYNCFPLDSSYEPINVDKINVTEGWYNTVIEGLTGELNFSIILELEKGTIADTTFVTNPAIRKGHNTDIYYTTFLDSCEISKPSGLLIQNVQFLSHTIISYCSASEIKDSIFGTLNTNLNAMNVTYAWNNIKSLINSTIVQSVIGHRTAYTKITNTSINLSSLFLGASWCGNSEDCNLSREVIKFDNNELSRFGLRLLAQVDRVLFKDIFTADSNTTTGNPNNLYLYDYSAKLDRVILNMNRYNFKLYRHDVDASDVQSIVNVMTPL